MTLGPLWEPVEAGGVHQPHIRGGVPPSGQGLDVVVADPQVLGRATVAGH